MYNVIIITAKGGNYNEAFTQPGTKAVLTIRLLKTIIDI